MIGSRQQALWSNPTVVEANTAVLPGCARPWRTPCAPKIHNRWRIAIVWIHCFKQQWREIAITAFSFGAYFGTGHIPSLKAHRVPATALDHAVPLLPWTVYGYVSLYPLLLANLVYLVPRPRALRPVLQAVTLANALSGMLFVTFRTTVPRPTLALALAVSRHCAAVVYPHHRNHAHNQATSDR